MVSRVERWCVLGRCVDCRGERAEEGMRGNKGGREVRRVGRDGGRKKGRKEGRKGGSKVGREGRK